MLLVGEEHSVDPDVQRSGSSLGSVGPHLYERENDRCQLTGGERGRKRTRMKDKPPQR